VALKVQKALHDAGIDPHTQGGGLCAGDLKTGPSDLLCVRYGAFGGTNSDKVYVDRMGHEDKREIPCPARLSGALRPRDRAAGGGAEQPVAAVGAAEKWA